MGDIRPGARIEQLVPEYAANGASAVSVLVDARFAGTIDDLRAARAVSDVPLLGKGFFSTEAQLRELRDAGADAALLILRDLDDDTCARLMRYATEIGLDTLVEAHTQEELTAPRLCRRRSSASTPAISARFASTESTADLVARAAAIGS